MFREIQEQRPALLRGGEEGSDQAAIPLPLPIIKWSHLEEEKSPLCSRTSVQGTQDTAAMVVLIIFLSLMGKFVVILSDTFFRASVFLVRG